MKMISQIFLPLLFIFSSCSLFNNDPKPLEAIPTFFYAEINGERFDANRANAAFSSTSNETNLSFSGSHFFDDIFPYRESISFSFIYQNNKTRYPLKLDSVLSEKIGFSTPFTAYFENDGDVIISDYQTPEDSDGFVTVELEELEDGRKTISGTFEMTVYLKKRINTAFPQQEQDTLHITNGKYLLELRDFRKEE